MSVHPEEFLGAQWLKVSPFAGPYDGILSKILLVYPVPQFGTAAFESQAKELVELSANLTDEQKIISEYWTDGPNSELPPGHWCLFAQFVSARDGHTLDDDVKMFFDDGSTFGDTNWANRLVQQRQSLLRYLGVAMNLLATAKNTGMSHDELLGRIQSESKMRLAGAQSHEEENAIRQVYKEAQINFERMTARDGSTIPLTDRIDQMSDQFLQERQRLLASKPSLAVPN